MEKIKIRLKAAAFALALALMSGAFVFSFFNFQPTALALTPAWKYNRDPATVPQNDLTIANWNELDQDFLLKEGDTWTGPGALNMGNHAITGLNTNLTAPSPTDAANVAYVLQEVAAGPASGGGEMYTVWGNNACAGGSTLLYGGIAFSARYDSYSGGSNPVCVEAGDPGAANTGLYADGMYPVVTGGSANLPTNTIDPGSTIVGDRIVRCAACHYPTGTCYVNYGSWDCNGGAGSFSPVYDGYALGSYSGPEPYRNSTQRYCVNRNFNGVAAGGNTGAMWFGTRIENNYGLTSYTTSSFIKCSVCCN